MVEKQELELQGEEGGVREGSGWVGCRLTRVPTQALLLLGIVWVGWETDNTPVMGERERM